MPGLLDWLPRVLASTSQTVGIEDATTYFRFRTQSIVFCGQYCNVLLYWHLEKHTEYLDVASVFIRQWSASFSLFSAVPWFGWHFLLASWRGLGAHQSHLQRKPSPGNPVKNRWWPNLGWSFRMGAYRCSMYTVSSHCVNDFFFMEASTCGPERSLLSYISAEFNLYILKSPAVQYEILLLARSGHLLNATQERQAERARAEEEILESPWPGDPRSLFGIFGWSFWWVKSVERPWKKTLCSFNISAWFLVILVFQTLFSDAWRYPEA